VEGVVDLRTRAVLDDGTGALTVNLDRVATERLWGGTLEGALSELRDRPDPSRVEEGILSALFGRRFAVTGRCTSDAFGITVHPESIRPISPTAPPDLGDLRTALERARR
jgi:ssDNA-binding replication factor A large subunit